MKGSKILATIVAIAMVLSTMAILNVSDLTVKLTVKATRDITTDANNHNAVVLSNDGSGNQWDKLTCGEIITLYVNNNSLTPDEDYAVKVFNDSGWQRCYSVSGADEADEYGDLAIQFHVPGWSELGECPTTGNATSGALGAGNWKISLWTESTGGTQVWTGLNITVTIGNLYDVYFTDNGTVNNLIYGEEESFDVNVRNWTGSDSWQETYSGTNGIGTWDLDILTPDFASVTGFPKTGINANSKNAYVEAYDTSKEYYYWVRVSSNANAAHFSNVSLPVKLDVTESLPSNAEWGDSFTIGGGVYDANNTGITGYDVAVYAPIDSGWTIVNGAADSTLGNGVYSIVVNTGPGDGYSAGTYYVGTYETGLAGRDVDEADQPPYIAGFIPYYSFEVGTNDGADVAVQNSDDIIAGFAQIINVSVGNDSFMADSSSPIDATKEFQNMKIHVTGLAGWDNETEYDEDDIVEVTPYVQHNSDDQTYYLFYYTFNETGTATIIASWPGNQTSQTLESPKAPGNDSYYSNTYYEATDMLANITGRTTFSIVSAASMNLIIEGDMVDAVSIDKNPGTCTGSIRWLNSSDEFTLKVYGSTQSDPQDATIHVSGCGLDFTIDQDDPEDTDECIDYVGTGVYRVQIAPKTSGTLTITATNGTDEASKDYTITGLTGSVTTSVGDDLEITVGTTETITAQLQSDYANVYVTYFDATWRQTDTYAVSLNHTYGDGTTAGEGKDGTYTFVPDVDYIDTLGHIVVAAEAGSGNYFYEIIEIVPVYDFTIELLEPINATQMFTAGLEYDVVFRILDGDLNAVEDDDPSVTIKLVDADHDEDSPLQSWSSADADISDAGDGEWELDDMRCWFEGQLIISGENATDAICHKGNLSVNVGLATISYSPEAATAGIGTENLTVEVTGLDANGDPLPDGTDIFFWCVDSEDVDIGGVASNTNAVNFKDADTSIELDEDGKGEFELDEVGDNKTTINATFVDYDPCSGNRTLGTFNINFPVFDISPETIYIGQSNIVIIHAYEAADGTTAIAGINLTLKGNSITQPNPVKTDADGKVILEVEPTASGIANVTIARDLHYDSGILDWTDAVVTDSYVTITSIKEFTITVSKSPVYQGETLTVTITSGGVAVEDVDVSFGLITGKTDASGEVDFTAPDPGVESVLYYVTAEKVGYNTKDKGVTVIKKYAISIVTPDTVYAGESFTVTIIAKGQPLAGATVTLDGTTVKTSDGDGKVTFTAGAKGTTHTITAAYEAYTSGSATIGPLTEKGTPGFELLTLIAAIGVAFILLRRRKHN